MIKVAGIYIIENYVDYNDLMEKLELDGDYGQPDRIPCIMLISQDYKKGWSGNLFYNVAFIYDIETMILYKKDRYDNNPISFT